MEWISKGFRWRSMCSWNRKYSIINKIKHVVIMGTTYNESVKIPYKEFNVKIDPESAKVVFDAGFKDIKINKIFFVLSYNN